jgi:hypothetical protein
MRKVQSPIWNSGNQESLIPVAELLECPRIFLLNAVRGMYRVEVVRAEHA